MRLSKTFSIAFDLKPRATNPAVGAARAILKMQTSDKFCCNEGDNIPMVAFRGDKTTRIRVCMDMDKPNQCLYIKDTLPVNKFTSVLLKQEEKDGKSIFSITIAGEEVEKKENKKPREFNNVRIWASGRFRDAGNAEMRNLEIRNLG